MIALKYYSNAVYTGNPVPKSDINDVIEENGDLWLEFKHTTILLLGGTGFIGTWIVSCLQEVDKVYNLNLKLIVITRSSTSVIKNNPGLLSKNVKLIDLDLAKNFNLTLNLDYDFFIHGATDSTFSQSTADSTPQSSVFGAHLILNSIKPSCFIRGIHLSSGAVFPKQLNSSTGQLEIENNEKFDSLSDYGKAKYQTESLLRKNFIPHQFEVSNPRLFTFFGPGIPLDKHFAVGNFLRNALNKEPIIVNGNPDTIRSYMYPTDLIIWIIKLLLNPTSSTLNFGSDIPITMADLATKINDVTGNEGIQFRGNSEPTSIYFPSTIKARQHLTVKQSVMFEEGIERWVSWLNNPS